MSQYSKLLMLEPAQRKLLGAVIRAANISGWTVNLRDCPPVSPSRLRLTPRTYLQKSIKSEDVILYIWNITHGGRNRAEDEYHVQVTGVSSIEQPPEYKTLILGYWEAQDVFAGWDVNFHSGPSSFSPSLQIREQYLLAAVENEFAVCPKEQGELAIAFSPSFLVTYCRNLEGLHAAGTLSEAVDALNHIAEQGSIDEVDLSPLSAPRQKVVRTIAQNYREASFRRRVLGAYSHACAMCGIQLKLVDAAHIIPVYDPQSTDETSNGICLCSLHHRAMDRVLIAVSPDYRILLNEAEIDRLGRENLGDGIELLTAHLGKVIRLPPEKTQRPKPDYLQAALQVRRWVT